MTGKINWQKYMMW